MSATGQPFEASGVWDDIGNMIPLGWSAEQALVILRYAYPSVVYLYFIFCTLASVLFLHTIKAQLAEKPDTFRSSLLVRGMNFCNITFLVQLASIFIHSLIVKKWLGREDEVVCLAASLLLFSMQSFRLSGSEHPVWYPFLGSWTIGLVVEPLLLTFQSMSSSPLRLDSLYDILTVVMTGCRVMFFAVALVSYVIYSTRQPVPISDEECHPLLAETVRPTTGIDSPSRPSSSYGSMTQASSTAHSVVGSQKGDDDGNDDDDDDPLLQDGLGAKDEAKLQKRLIEEGSWFAYMKKYKVLFPYIWPVGNYKLQFNLVLVLIFMMATNALNMLLPRQIGIIMDSLTGDVSSAIWKQLLVFAILKLLTSECGLSFLTEWFYFPVSNYSREALNRAAFEHVLKLSADFHDSKSTSETLMSIRGGEECSTIIETVLFDGFARFVDLMVAIIYLTSTFGPYEGLISVTAGTLYLLLSANLVTNTGAVRREYVAASYDENRALYKAIDGWQTVASFNQTLFENNRYANAVHTLIKRIKAYTFSWYGTRALQSISLMGGLFSGCVLAVLRIQNEQATAGQFAMLLMYWGQLTGPLMYVTYLSKRISRMMIDAERILDLLNTKTTIIDQPGAQPLRLTHGDVEFNGVSFAYANSKAIIQGLSFHVHGGQSVAFVGATGAGKSTILKLLSRFYDAKSGTITIDHQDITSVQIESLRSRIGLVPQSPVLFNDTIMNNVRYADMNATDEEVYDACKAAHIHDKIMGFPQKYLTKVGERGVKLSGGELQRLAIARAILKRPDIVLLDEATSAVDTDTEQKIQESFRRLTENRTTFIVAHRLSTIMNADRIIVIGDGKILEMGNHESLLKAQGKYYNLWTKQVFVRNKNTESKGQDCGKPSEFVNDLCQDVIDALRAKATDSSTVSVTGSSDGLDHGHHVTNVPENAPNAESSEHSKPPSSS